MICATNKIRKLLYKKNDMRATNKIRKLLYKKNDMRHEQN